MPSFGGVAGTAMQCSSDVSWVCPGTKVARVVFLGCLGGARALWLQPRVVCGHFPAPHTI